jgi:CRISPR-associated DxTHG motif protein
MEAISFLGVPRPRQNKETGLMEEGRYMDVIYCWRRQNNEVSEYTTCLFPLALCEFFKPERLHLFVTAEADRHSHCREIERAVGRRLNKVLISDGNSEEQLWEIFQKVTDTVQAGSEVVFDITHGFRSLPLVVFLAVAYLCQVKQIKLHRVVYGNFEARDKETNRAPVFDLTSFVVLLDWLTGVKTLRQRDDAEQLADLLSSRHSSCWSNDSPLAEDIKPRQLEKLSGALRKLSYALQLSRPVEVMKQAGQLKKKLVEARPEVEQLSKPFAVLLQDIETEYNPYALPQPSRLTKENLSLQLALIQRYASRGLAMQAVSLAREWLVSFVMLEQDPEHWLSIDGRRPVESKLSSGAQKLQSGPEHMPQQPQGTGLKTEQPLSKEILNAWGEISQLRNDIDHCGLRENPRPTGSIMKAVKRLPEKLQNLLG